jgi:hypothetical protein
MIKILYLMERGKADENLLGREEDPISVERTQYSEIMHKSQPLSFQPDDRRFAGGSSGGLVLQELPGDMMTLRGAFR